jgi:hypothetical protein
VDGGSTQFVWKVNAKYVLDLLYPKTGPEDDPHVSKHVLDLLEILLQ